MAQNKSPSLAGLNTSDESLERWDTLIGKTLDGKYLIEDMHGEGACAVVYSAKELNSDRVVAVKALKYSEPDVDRRFAREAEIHSKLRHPNIVEPIDFVVLPDGQSFFVMELLDGTDLGEYLDEHERFDSLDEVMAIISQVCDAISYAHFEGVVHRDLKPENIVVLENDGPVRIKVLDFGLAKIEEDLQRLTKTGVVLGSPAYMSPEQCMGLKLDQRSDLYSLAVVAYELLTGALPFVEGDNPIAMMEAHCDHNVKPQQISQLRAEVPNCSKLQSIIDQALHTDAEHRFQSIDEFREQLWQWWQSTGGSLAAFAREKRTGTPKPILDFDTADSAQAKISSETNDLVPDTRKSGDLPRSTGTAGTTTTSQIRTRARPNHSSKKALVWAGFAAVVLAASIALAYLVLSF
jgi:Serine/threonine protein kinase